MEFDRKEENVVGQVMSKCLMNEKRTFFYKILIFHCLGLSLFSSVEKKGKKGMSISDNSFSSLMRPWGFVVII